MGNIKLQFKNLIKRSLRYTARPPPFMRRANDFQFNGEGKNYAPFHIFAYNRKIFEI